MEKINNLGRYADLNAVWTQHPEGGREGDYLTIGVSGKTYYWDNVDRDWVVGSSGGSSSQQGQIIDGDLSVGGNLNVAGDATVGGTLTVGDIQIANGGRFKGQSIHTSFVFCRKTNKPAKPVGGSFSDPQPDGVLWSDGVPQGTDHIWMSSRIFTSDGQAPQQAEWKDPVLLRDDETTDIEFSPASADTVPAEPSDNNRGVLWFDPTQHPGAAWDSMNWLAIATKSIDGNGNEVYGPWTISLIKGERGADGDTYENVFYRTKVFVAPLININSSQYQNDDYLPGVSNKAACQGEGNTFTDDPKGVTEEWKYEWFLTRHKADGTWLAFANNGNPALWATFSKDHSITISDDGYWVIDGTKTDKQAIGTGVSIKGRVDVYSDSEITDNETSLESYPSGPDAPSELEVGDCWIVTSGTDGDDNDVSGHLFICVATTGTLAQMWQDLGEFKGEKGEDGHGQYLYIAWAQNVHFSGNPQAFESVDNFTTDPAEGQTYGWMGIKVSDEEISGMDQSSNAYRYKWNYLKGRDGMDYEHVYIRTSVNIAPTIDPQTVSHVDYQDPEFPPDVFNISQYSYHVGSNNNTIEFGTFTDDPSGVSERWPYEWVARREKVNGVWQAFQTPATLHNNWAEQGPKGDDGAGQAYIVTTIDQIVVDCGADGRPTAAVSKSFESRLKWGDEVCELSTSSCSVTENTVGSLTTVYPQVSGSRKYANTEYSINPPGLDPLPVLTSGLITINLTGTDSNGVSHSATKTIVVIANKQGQSGTNGETGPVLRFRGKWSASESYTFNDTFRDCVKHGDTYYILTGQHDGLTAEPGTTGSPWTSMGGDMKFFATEILLAENAVIQLLSSNTLIFTDANGNKTAGINEDGQGSYRTYYPDTGRLRKDDNADGWTYYYNNDADNTLAWMLGPSGAIIRTGTVTMSKIKMSQSAIAQVGDLISYNPDLNVTVVDRYVFTNEDSDNNGKVYMTGSISNNEPAAGNSVVPNGIYSQSSTWLDMCDKDEDKYYHYLPLVRVSNGKIADKRDVIIEYQPPLQG